MIQWYILKISRNESEESTRIVGELGAPTHYKAALKAMRLLGKRRFYERRDRDAVRQTPYYVVQSRSTYEIKREEQETLHAGRMRRKRWQRL